MNAYPGRACITSYLLAAAALAHRRRQPFEHGVRVAAVADAEMKHGSDEAEFADRVDVGHLHHRVFQRLAGAGA